MPTHSIAKWRPYALAGAFLAIGLAAKPQLARADFIEIATTNTSVPNGAPGETFGNGLGIRPAASNGTVVFLGAGNMGTDGLYTGNGGSLSIVADTNTVIPGTSNKFASFADNPAFSGNNVSFNVGDNSAVYARLSGTLVTIANTSQTVPDGFGDFQFLTNSTISGSNVAFSASGESNQSGVYSSFNGGALNVVADTHSAQPGGSGNFSGLGEPAISGTNVVFTGSGTNSNGIYDNASGTGGTITRIVDTTTPIPGGSGDFAEFGRVVVSGSNVAFVATDSTTARGIYSVIGGTLAAVANDSTLVPGGGTDTFESNDFGDVSISGSTVAFTGGGANEFGIYIDSGGTLSKLIATGDTLDGQPVDGLSIFSDSVDGNTLAFTAQLGGTSAVFLATLPEPTALPFLGLAALPCLARKRRTAH